MGRLIHSLRKRIEIKMKEDLHYDQLFLKTALQDSEEAFRELFFEFFPALCIYAANIVGDDEIARDIVQMAISRQREFLADATSVRLTRNALGLVSALEKLAASTEPMPGANRATQHLFIVNPLRNFGEDASALLATHPPIERRIARLLNLGAKGY